MSRSEVTVLSLVCACGAWRGALEASAEAGTRAVCYCDDCQAYAKFLGRDDTMDAAGGTEVVQTWPARVTVTAGALSLVRLSPKGLHRWFAGCCRAPIANTMGKPRLPFVGLMTRRVVPEQRDELTRILGPAVGVQGRFAPGGCPPGALASANLSVIGGAIALLARGGWRRGHRPSPFFDEAGQPIASARVLTQQERDALR